MRTSRRAWRPRSIDLTAAEAAENGSRAPSVITLPMADDHLGSLGETYSFVVGLMEAATPRSAARAAAAHCASHFDAPAAVWFTSDGGRSLEMIDGHRLGPREMNDLEASLGTVPRWELLDRREQESLRRRFLEITGCRDSISIDAGDCLILVASDAADIEVLENIGRLLEAVLRHLTVVALAEARNESLDFGLALTAHEFLSPVVSMKHAFELLRRTGERPEIETRLLDHAVRALDRLADLCDGLRRWSFRPEPPRYTTIDLNAAAREAAGADELEADRDRIRIGATDRLEVRADHQYLVGAIRNLLRCVLKAAPEAPVEVRIEKHGQFGRVEVQLEGPERPETRSPAQGPLLDPFAVEEGTSLGSGSRPTLDLFMSRKVLESHGGTIGVGPGGFGSSFFIQLPISEKRL